MSSITESEDPPVTSIGEQPYPSPKVAWWVLGVLFLALLVSYVDRQIPALVVDGMKRDLGMSDAQAAWMYSGFAIFYAIAGIPLAWLSDRHNRKAIVSIGITIWSIMTVMCGFAKGFGSLFAARIGVGVGEATLGPATHSLVGDLFPRHLIPRALSVFQVGAVVGSGLAFYVVGLVLEYIEANPPGPLPYVGQLHDWQWTFIYVGLPGLLVLLLMLTVREPIRRRVSAAVSKGQHATKEEIIAFYKLNWKTFLTHHIGFAFLGLIGFAFVFWTPEFFYRVHGLPVSQSAQTFGLIFMVSGALGVLWAAWLGERFARRNVKSAYVSAGALGGALTIPFIFLIQVVPNPTWAFILYAPAMFFVNSPFGMANGAIPVITPPNMRAVVASVSSLMSAILAMGLGPPIAGYLNDQVFTGPEGVRYSLMTMAIVCGVIGLSLLWKCRGYYAESLVRADAWETEQLKDS